MAFPPAMMHAPAYPPYCGPAGYPGPQVYHAPIYHGGAPLMRVPSHHAAPAAYAPQSAAYPSQSAAYAPHAPPLPPPQAPRYDSANPFGNRTCRQHCRTAGTHERGPQDINASFSSSTRQDPLASLPSSAMPHGYPRVRCEISMGGSRVAEGSGSPSRAPNLAGYTARYGLAGVSGRHSVNFYDVDQIAGALVRAAGSKLSADTRPQTFVAQVLGRAQVQLSVALHALLLLRAPSSVFVLASISPEQRLLAALSLAHRAGTEVGICTGCWAHIGNYCWAGEGRAWLGADAFVGGVVPFSKEAMRNNTEGLLRATSFNLHVGRVALENVTLEILRPRTPEALTSGAADGERHPRARPPPAFPDLSNQPHTVAAGARRARHAHPRSYPSTEHLVYAPSVYDDAGDEPDYDHYPPSASDSRSRTLSLGAGARLLSAAAQQRVGAFHHRPSPLVVYGASGYLV